MEFKIWLAQQMTEKQLGQADLARLSRVPQPTIQRILSGETSDPRGSTIGKIERALGANQEWREIGEIPRNEVIESDLCLSIPTLSNSGSMGGGAQEIDEDLVIGALTVQRSWVAKQLPNISSAVNLRFIHSYGDSMKPTFSDGDVLLVDAGIKDPAVDGVYVLAVRDQLYIKRVSRRFDGKHEISSDNPSVKTVEVLNGDHQVDVKGRVVWAWKGERL